MVIMKYSIVDNINLEILTSCNQYWVDSYDSTLYTKEKRACVKRHVCQDRSFECDVSKPEKSAAQSLQSWAERICIGRLMCFPPRPCHCFHVTTAWQPGKWDTAREKRVESGFCLSKKRTDKTQQLDILTRQWWWHSDGGTQTLHSLCPKINASALLFKCVRTTINSVHK